MMDASLEWSSPKGALSHLNWQLSQNQIQWSSHDWSETYCCSLKNLFKKEKNNSLSWYLSISFFYQAHHFGQEQIIGSSNFFCLIKTFLNSNQTGRWKPAAGPAPRCGLGGRRSSGRTVYLPLASHPIRFNFWSIFYKFIMYLDGTHFRLLCYGT